MSLSVVVSIIWGAFWVGWLLAAVGAKRSAPRRRTRTPGLLALIAFVLLRAFRTGALAIHSPVVRGVGMVVLVSGLGLAVWARVYLGRNWGMPMTEREEPELVTSGPYRFVRHPIYSGLLLAALGTALVVSLYWLIALGILAIYFIYSARTEERRLTSTFPDAYPSYRARTKMLIPFVL